MLDWRGFNELSVTPWAIPDFLAFAFALVFTHSALFLTAVATVLTLV
jgi:hypothetical protein